uniref:Uncharacterized protein n=1 Tax=Timema genevievae TaxID=629358 RepID=A0A7R9K5W0_TIMGE|nr:unnamed protein product [Timema genevievae]
MMLFVSRYKTPRLAGESGSFFDHIVLLLHGHRDSLTSIYRTSASAPLDLTMSPLDRPDLCLNPFCIDIFPLWKSKNELVRGSLEEKLKKWVKSLRIYDNSDDVTVTAGVERVDMYALYPHVSEGRVENNLGKTTLSTPNRDSSLVLPIISSLVYCKSSALEHAATDEDHVWWTCVSVLMADVTVNRSQHMLMNAKGDTCIGPMKLFIKSHEESLGHMVMEKTISYLILHVSPPTKAEGAYDHTLKHPTDIVIYMLRYTGFIFIVPNMLAEDKVLTSCLHIFKPGTHDKLHKKLQPEDGVV